METAVYRSAESVECVDILKDGMTVAKLYTSTGSLVVINQWGFSSLIEEALEAISHVQVDYGIGERKEAIEHLTIQLENLDSETQQSIQLVRDFTSTLTDAQAYKADIISIKEEMRQELLALKGETKKYKEMLRETKNALDRRIRYICESCPTRVQCKIEGKTLCEMING